ncbi:ABC transporter ATP-binding protein [Spirilliplanes yamanashiensis]|uniref:ABC transporter ATP-binding protein n=1 Tax=Spirilliplanes yamanashiensis TaxID=42233 RepID=A0A8J3Y9W4_9ACTN|nr:ABC transporter ATP-binding protein [Spirilliplanes yamanashiensis]MDP9815641.1 ABC-2 type transport system ATP-binding protein [Spirilliplanes yamanashiensis]GIJ03895.1 ABC transporter ATP-binding protein [Spirilliplanes yamanashiensis]
MRETPALSVAGVVVRYGETTALDGVDLRLERGTVLSLLGPNGAGKTSLLQVCEGYRRPDGGTVEVLGADPHTARGWLMPRVGIMLQGGGLHPSARAGELLKLFASYAANPLDLDMLVERLELGRFLGTRYRRLSGGEQQRLALALAVVGRPELVFLDEPTAGMDAQARRATWDIIRALRHDGVSVLLTTHLLDEAEKLADDVVIIRRGEVIATGTPQQLTAAAGIESLHVDADPGLAVATAALPGDAAITEEIPGRYTVTGRVDAAVAAAVLGWFAAQGAHVTAVQSRRRTLEDVFLEVTLEGAR